MQTEDDKYLSRLKDSRTSRIQQNHRKNIQNLLLSQNEETDRRNDKEMRHMCQNEAQSA